VKFFFLIILFRTSNCTNLLQNSWPDLFVLGLSQCRDDLHLSSILTSIAAQFKDVAALDRVAVTRVRQVTQAVCKIKEYTTALSRLEMDEMEFGLMRVIAIFGSGIMFWTIIIVNIIISTIQTKLLKTHHILRESVSKQWQS
jgi:hypothetical protein